MKVKVKCPKCGRILYGVAERECSRWYQNEKGEVRCDDCDWLAATGGPEALAEAVEEHRYCGGCGAKMIGEIDTEVVMW